MLRPWSITNASVRQQFAPVIRTRPPPIVLRPSVDCSLSPSVRPSRSGWTRDSGVSTLTYYKGHENLIRTISRLPEVGYLIVGAGEKRNALLTLTWSLGLPAQVKILGFRSKQALRALLANCDAEKAITPPSADALKPQVPADPR
jgi:glycosyltransferase involved in cell wall biosynthesis